MHRSRTRLIAGTAAAVLPLLLAVGAASPAAAATKTVTDPQDAPAHLDIRSATLRTGPQALTAIVRVRDLGRRGLVMVRIGPPQSEFTHAVVVSRTNARYVRLTPRGSQPAECAVSGKWNQSTNLVAAVVPRSCYGAIAPVVVQPTTKRAAKPALVDLTRPVTLR